jgi:hypothetical protein
LKPWTARPYYRTVLVANVVEPKKYSQYHFTYLLCGLSPQANYTDRATAAFR